MMVIASKVGQEAGLQHGYRIVLNNGKHGCQIIPNLYLDVLGGQELKWPPFNPNPNAFGNFPTKVDEEVKGDQGEKLNDFNAMDRYLRFEMGFSLIVKEMIDQKKPLIGHNCMYDWIYFYNQFIGKLPETYLQFAQ